MTFPGSTKKIVNSINVPLVDNSVQKHGSIGNMPRTDYYLTTEIVIKDVNVDSVLIKLLNLMKRAISVMHKREIKNEKKKGRFM